MDKEEIEYPIEEELEEYMQICKKLQQENKQLKDNWNKLKEILSRVIVDNSSGEYDQDMWLSSDILDIMQKLEKSDRNE